MDLWKKTLEKNPEIFVAASPLRKRVSEDFNNIVTRTHAELDLIDQAAVKDFFDEEKPDYVFLAAAKVGGIHANNTYPADFIYEIFRFRIM